MTFAIDVPTPIPIKPMLCLRDIVDIVIFSVLKRAWDRRHCAPEQNADAGGIKTWIDFKNARPPWATDAAI
jgi:hypothetical protein